VTQRTYPVGTSSTPLIVTLNNGGPVTGETVKARIIVPWLGLGFDFSDDTFKLIGLVVTPELTLTEALTPGGVYFGLWNTSGIVADADTIVIYQSVGPNDFIADDPVTFYTAGAASTAIINAFVQAVFDATNRTLTVVGGIKNAESGLIVSTSATFTVKNELDQVLFSGGTTSTTGIHRHIFPNVSLPPNRILLIHADFVAPPSTFSTVEPITVLGTGA
jgi:hypothetical protein